MKNNIVAIDVLSISFPKFYVTMLQLGFHLDSEHDIAVPLAFKDSYCYALTMTDLQGVIYLAERRSLSFKGNKIYTWPEEAEEIISMITLLKQNKLLDLTLSVLKEEIKHATRNRKKVLVKKSSL